MDEKEGRRKRKTKTRKFNPWAMNVHDHSANMSGGCI
jgi:hypothetical protein